MSQHHNSKTQKTKPPLDERGFYENKKGLARASGSSSTTTRVAGCSNSNGSANHNDTADNSCGG
jgi:hypothetical protein